MPRNPLRPAPRPLSLALGAAIALFTACTGSSRPIVVGAAGPWKEAYGAMNKMGIDLAVEEINAHGGVRHRPLRVLEQDDEGQGTKAAQVAADFVANRDVVAVVG